MIQDPEGIELRMLLRAANFTGRSVLEVGCGDGRVSAMLSRFAGSLTCIDPDDARLAKARQKVARADFRSGVGEALEFPNGSFDIVAFTFSLHHQDARAALREAGRVLRPGGRIVVVEPDLGGDMHPLFRLFSHEDDKIEWARAAMRTSGFATAHDETFDIEYLFDDMEDVYEYFFGNYGLPREPERMAEMAAVVGAKATQKPLRLLERANITTLLKA